MSHTQTITRQHRTACLLLLDLSGSMRGVVEYNGKMVQKCELAIAAANKIIRELYIRAWRNNELRDYYDIAVIGYSAERVFSLLNDDIDDPFIPITELKSDFKLVMPLSPDTKLRGSAIEVTPGGSTPMYEAMYYIYKALRNWCSKLANIDSYPPVIWHMTDGQPSDCDLDSIVDIARRIISVGTNDGETLLFNMHLDSDKHSLRSIFPTDEEIASHHNAFVRMLGSASSKIPESLVPFVEELRESRKEGGYRGLGYGTSMSDLISMMTIGTLNRAIK